MTTPQYRIRRRNTGIGVPAAVQANGGCSSAVDGLDPGQQLACLQNFRRTAIHPPAPPMTLRAKGDFVCSQNESPDSFEIVHFGLTQVSPNQATRAVTLRRNRSSRDSKNGRASSQRIASSRLACSGDARRCCFRARPKCFGQIDRSTYRTSRQTQAGFGGSDLVVTTANDSEVRPGR